MKKAPQNTFTFTHEGKQFYARVFNAGHKAVDPLTLSKYFDKRTEVLTSETQMQKQWANRFSDKRDELLLMNQELQAKIKSLEDANLMKTADVAYQIEQKEKVEAELGEKCEELRDLEKDLKQSKEVALGYLSDCKKLQNQLNAHKTYIKNLKISAWVAVGVFAVIAIGALGYISYITQ